MIIFRQLGFYRSDVKMRGLPVRLRLFCMTFSSMWGIALVKHMDIKERPLSDSASGGK